MKLGDVLKKERTKAKLEAAEVARRLGVTPEAYAKLESGESDAETWGPALARIAIALEVPTSRLLAETGRSADAKPGRVGALVKGHRERRSKTAATVAEATRLDAEQYERLERGESPLETVGPQLLAFAEAVEQPIFNLFYPCGLPFEELDDYP
jgi:transcriptional regulator with XRE-family HTH domain